MVKFGNDDILDRGHIPSGMAQNYSSEDSASKPYNPVKQATVEAEEVVDIILDAHIKNKKQYMDKLFAKRMTEEAVYNSRPLSSKKSFHGTIPKQNMKIELTLSQKKQ